VRKWIWYEISFYHLDVDIYVFIILTNNKEDSFVFVFFHDIMPKPILKQANEFNGKSVECT